MKKIILLIAFCAMTFNINAQQNLRINNNLTPQEHTGKALLMIGTGMVLWSVSSMAYSYSYDDQYTVRDKDVNGVTMALGYAIGIAGAITIYDAEKRGKSSGLKASATGVSISF